MSHELAIIQYQSQLQFLARKMVGSIQDAEDILQDTFEKWLKVDLQKVTCAKSYLISAVTNNCIKFLESKKQQMLKKAQDIYEHASAVIDSHSHKDILKFDMNAQMNQAFQTLHQKLEPLEKSVFVLREIFDINYEELQLILELKNDNLRKLMSRAKHKLRQAPQIKKPTLNLPNLQHSFQVASAKGALNDLISDLKKEVSKIQKK